MRDVVDPELGINVVDLGLVYGITVDARTHAVIDMTLTSAACPLTDVIEDQTAAGARGPRRRRTASTGCGCRRGAPTRSPTTAASSCAPSASTSDPQTLVTSRVVEVAPARLDGWLERFAANNPDGPPAGRRRAAVRPRPARRRPRPTRWVCRGRRLAATALTAHKVGTRYVQSRTAAGGWTQQRFARRRATRPTGSSGRPSSTRCGC